MHIYKHRAKNIKNTLKTFEVEILEKVKSEKSQLKVDVLIYKECT